MSKSKSHAIFMSKENRIINLDSDAGAERHLETLPQASPLKVVQPSQRAETFISGTRLNGRQDQDEYK